MDTKLFLFEDDNYENFYPLTVNRPVFTLLSGLFPLWEKWRLLVGETAISFDCRGELAKRVRENTGIICNRFDFSDCRKIVFINGRVRPEPDLWKLLNQTETSCLFLNNGNLAAMVLLADSLEASNIARMNYWGYGHLKSLISQLPKQEVKVDWYDYIWDFIARNPVEIESDFHLFIEHLSKDHLPPDNLSEHGILVYKPESVLVAPSAKIDGQTVLDARGGPIVVGEDVYISAHTRIEGPAFIGPQTQLLGAKVREGCSFGPVCRVGGEVEESIFLGYTNKYHEGFIGHAYLGQWVNLGALTTNSDLKNNYGNIRVDLGYGQIDSGQMKVGSFVGDHVKTGIGTLLNTGISIGFASNIFGGGLTAEKYIPPFIWGGNGGYAEYRLDKALVTAEVSMARRKRKLSADDKHLFNEIYDTSADKRRKFISKNEDK